MGILLPQITCLPGFVHKGLHPALEQLGGERGGAFLHLLFDLQCPHTSSSFSLLLFAAAAGSSPAVVLGKKPAELPWRG